MAKDGGGQKLGPRHVERLSGFFFVSRHRDDDAGIVERAYLLKALRQNDGNISRTAEAIGMVRQSLQQKIRELDLRSEDWTRDP